MPHKEDLQAEWARANKAGGGANRRKAMATFASVAIAVPIVGLGYFVMLVFWPFDKIPVLFLALPWLPALPAGWWVRQKLWPRGALGR
jgi:hypothetical protein